jgi:CBS domain containing-hemolysin-like protein
MDGMIDQVPEILLGVLAVLGIALGALLSAAESALQRITRAAVAEMRQEGRRRADAVDRVVADRQAALTAVSFARVLAEMVAAVCLTLLVADLLPRWWQVLLVAVAISALLVTLVVGLSPRELGRRHPEDVLHALSGVVLGLTVLARPVTAVAARMRRGQRAHRARGARGGGRGPAGHGGPRVRERADRGGRAHDAALRLRTRPHPDPGGDGATHRHDHRDPGHSAREGPRPVRRSGFSRVPVIGDGVDDMRGMLYLKDALRATRRTGDAALSAADVMRPVRFVPEMKLVDDLLREMQAESSHIAVVIDEYGGVAGLVTIEDLLEELVGELQDEHDADLPEIEDLGEGTFRIPARMAVDELGDLFDMEIDDDDVDTAGGLLAKALGKVPIEGAEADVLGLHLVAERADGRRRQISTMLASRAPRTRSRHELPGRRRPDGR